MSHLSKVEVPPFRRSGALREVGRGMDCDERARASACGSSFPGSRRQHEGCEGCGDDGREHPPCPPHAVAVSTGRRSLARAASLAHRPRGRPSNNRLEADLRETALSLVRSHSADFGPTLAAEKLAGRHAVTVSRETLRTWMTEDGLWLSRKPRRTFLQPRLRRGCFGELPRIDGSDPPRSRRRICRDLRLRRWPDRHPLERHLARLAHLRSQPAACHPCRNRREQAAERSSGLCPGFAGSRPEDQQRWQAAFRISADREKEPGTAIIQRQTRRPSRRGSRTGGGAGLRCLSSPPCPATPYRHHRRTFLPC